LVNTGVIWDTGNSAVADMSYSQLWWSHGVRDIVLNCKRPDELEEFCRISDHLEKHSFVKNGNLDPKHITHMRTVDNRWYGLLKRAFREALSS
jgi:hypothetical protein